HVLQHFSFHFSAHLLHLPSFPTRRSSDLVLDSVASRRTPLAGHLSGRRQCCRFWCDPLCYRVYVPWTTRPMLVKRLKARLSRRRDRKSTRLNSSHLGISYAVFCLKKKKKY